MCRCEQTCHPERSEGSDMPGTEILRCAQDDNLLPILLVKLHYRPHRHSVNVLLEEERPSQGRPQGSHPLILTTPAHTKTRIGHCPLRSLCMGGCRVVRSGDPCGPYTGRFFGKREI